MPFQQALTGVRRSDKAAKLWWHLIHEFDPAKARDLGLGHSWSGSAAVAMEWSGKHRRPESPCSREASAPTDSGQRDRFARFRNEIRFLIEHEDYPGIVPILDHDLPEEAEAQAWYAMPVAQGLLGVLGEDPPVEAVLTAIASIAGTLAALALEGVAHRDIKPDNLFARAGNWEIGDFGLVAYPKKDPLTVHGRRLGPIDFMAPEIRDAADLADPHAADVWSLAQTLWTTLVGDRHPVGGPHQMQPPWALTSRIEHPRAAQLDRVLMSATRWTPADRLTMRDFESELLACLVEPPEEREFPDRSDLVARLRDLVTPALNDKVLQQEYQSLLTAGDRALQERIVHPIYFELGAPTRRVRLPPTNHGSCTGGLPQGRASWHHLRHKRLHHQSSTANRGNYRVGRFLRTEQHRGPITRCEACRTA